MFGRSKYRLVRSFYLRPVLPFIIEFAMVAPLSLGVEAAEVRTLYLFASPWLFVGLALLNLPFARFAFEAFRIDLPTRRNHALEHATILVLRARGLRASGRASARGFRVSGGPSPDEIRAAFDAVRCRVQLGAPLTYISRSCGSNRVTALALALGLLLVATIVNVTVRPRLALRAAALGAVVLSFVALRHVVGNWLQRRCFMATDFSSVDLRDVRKVPTGWVDEPPTYFAETNIQVR
jgi:hypothetical protein